MATQKGLSHQAEVTVWTQADWELSQSILTNLIVAVRQSDFGVFIFAPDDMTKMRSHEFPTVRDNVVFELGLFIGRLGAERSFIVLPKDSENLHLPTDLLGLVAATYDPHREDGNWKAAMGPACYDIGKAITRLGRLSDPAAGAAAGTALKAALEDEGDIKAALQSWMGNRPIQLNTQAIMFADVDRELNLPAGSAANYLEDIARRWNFCAAQRGRNSILFEQISTDVPYF